MLLRVDPSSPQPLYEQLAAGLRGAIAKRELRPGDRLPPARKLADGLDVNVHTVLRAFAVLRDEGLLEVRRGRGSVVTTQAPRMARLTELAQRLVRESRRAGLVEREILSLVEALL